MKTHQAIIITLLVVNLMATFWFGLGLNARPFESMVSTPRATQHNLPSFVTSGLRVNVFNEFQNAFNSLDYDALYDMFGDAAKAKFSKEAVKEEFTKLSNTVHGVESGAYTHAEFTGSNGSTQFYIIHYAVMLSENSKLGRTGKLQVTIGVQGNHYEIYGMQLSAAQ